jgi:hypothetical protein
MKSRSNLSASFYSDLPIFRDFRGVADGNNYHDVPDDWLVVVSDIKGSTKAIESGRYKEVNILGASSIIAVLNYVQNVEIPFVFGGDGASFVIPEFCREPLEKALDGTRRLAISSFDMDLRIGIVPVKIIVAGGFRVRIAKMQVSPWGTLAMFSGGGLAFAEKLIKNPETSATYEIQPGSDHKEDQDLFAGLECRWEPIYSKKEKPCASWFWPGVMMKLKKLKPIPNSLKKCKKFMERTIALSAQVK